MNEGLRGTITQPCGLLWARLVEGVGLWPVGGDVRFELAATRTSCGNKGTGTAGGASPLIPTGWCFPWRVPNEKRELAPSPVPVPFFMQNDATQRFSRAAAVTRQIALRPHQFDDAADAFFDA